MARIRIVGMAFLMLFACQAQQYLDRRCSTTNDIDEVFGERLSKDTVLDIHFLMRLSNTIDLEAKTNDVSALRRHVVHKVLDVKVTTNRIIVAGHRLDSAGYLLDKAKLVTKVADEWCVRLYDRLTLSS